MKKIAYIELDTHAEIALNFWTISQELKHINVDFYLSEKVVKLFPDASTSTITLSSEEKILEQLSTQNYDTVIIGTTHRYYNTYYKIAQQYPTSILIHNLNFVQLGAVQLWKLIWKKDTIYRLKLWLKEGLLKAPKLYKKAKNLLVLDENQLQFTGQFKQKTCFFPVFFNEFSTKNLTQTKVIVPGTVSQERRDYESIFTKISHFTTPIEIVFLGKASGKELTLLKDLQKKIQPTVRIIFFEEKIPNSIFEKEMLSGTVLWCPLQETNSFFSQQEEYGKTKMSGNISDAIKYGKPALFPSSYPHKHPFIINLISDVESQIHSINPNHFSFEKEYHINKVAEQLEKVLEKL